MEKDLYELARQLGQTLKEQQLKLITAESCTGGWISQAVTAIVGSSTWFICGFVTYSDESKQKLLGVSSRSLKEFGAVSPQVAVEMAEGALQNNLGNVSLAVTGIAGPSGGSAEKSVGTCWFAFASPIFSTQTECRHFSGDRTEVRYQAVLFALRKLQEIITSLKPA